MRNRAAWIDALRILACAFVVIFHVAAPLIPSAGGSLSFGVMSAAFYSSISSACVPLFIMITGALLVPSALDQNAAGFFRHRAKLVLPLVFWSVSYLLVRHFPPERLSLRGAAAALASAEPYYHLWYLYMLPGLYLLVPVCASAVRRLSATARRSILLVAALISAAAALLGHAGVIPNIDTGWLRFIPHAFYLLAGYELSQLHLKKPGFAAMAALAVVAPLVMLVATWLLLDSGQGRWLPLVFLSTNPLVIIYAAALFVLGNSISFKESSFMDTRVTRSAVLATFGVYLIHPLLLRSVAVIGVPDSLPVAVTIPVVSLVVFLWSWLAVEAIRRAPFLRRLVMI